MNAMRMMPAALLLLSGTAAIAQTAPSTTPATPTTSAPYPGEVAMVEEGEKGVVYRRFPTNEQLYISDADPVGRSACNRGCISAWPAVLAPADAKPVGDWTIVVRKDGTRQWALKGKPVYSRFHDLPLDRKADRHWRMLSATVAAALPGPVAVAAK